jgi:hypothetical protein
VGSETPKPVTLEQQGLLHTILWRSRAAQSEITLHHMLSQIYGFEGCPCNNGSPHSMEGVVGNTVGGVGQDRPNHNWILVY